jgi:hypothetical protein
MTYLQPFFLLMGRASVFWIGAVAFLSLSFLVAVLGQPDEIFSPYIDAAFLAAVGFPILFGWLGGAVIQEFQHCSCAWPLPRLNRRLGAGFLASGSLVVLVVAGLVSEAQINTQHFAVLLAIGLAAYCLGGTFFDPLRPWMASVTLVVILLAVSRSLYLSELVAAHPAAAIAVALTLGALSLHRLFCRSNLRLRLFHPTSPFPGSYSMRRSAEFERKKLAARRPKATVWRAGYLDSRMWSWVRAVAYAGYGPVTWKTALKMPSRLWALGLVFAVHSWANRGNSSFAEALGRTLSDALLQSPHNPTLVDRGEHDPIVILVVAAMGVALAITSPSSLLKTTLAYPISRRFQAGVTFRAGLVDIAVFFVGLSVALTVLGLLCGWLVGYDIRFDFIPFFFRPLAITVIAMPLALWGHLQLQVAHRRKTENTLVAVVFGVIGFVATVWIATVLSPRAFPLPIVEVGVLTVLFVASALAYRSRLREYFSKADVT